MFRLPNEVLALVLMDFVRQHSSCCVICKKWRDLAHHQNIKVHSDSYHDVPSLLERYPSCKLRLNLISGHDTAAKHQVLIMMLKLKEENLPLEDILVHDEMWVDPKFRVGLLDVLHRSKAALRKVDLGLSHSVSEEGLRPVLASLAMAEGMYSLALNMYKSKSFRWAYCGWCCQN